MKILQFHLPNQGKRVGVLEDDQIIDITTPDVTSVLKLLEDSVQANRTLEESVHSHLKSLCSTNRIPFAELGNQPAPNEPYLLLPIDAPEVYGCGVTYKRSASERDVDSTSDIYTRIYFSDRPEIFFKATPARCATPNDAVTIRRDSELTAAEPELAFIMGGNGTIVGYSVCNDVSAWDIERDNPLYLQQSKTYSGCCSFGPVIATPEDVPDPYNLDLTCRIARNGSTVFEETINTSSINRKFETLIEHLIRDNEVPIGTTVSTGTGIMVPNEFALQDNDVVEIEIEKIGVLRNAVRQLGR